MADDLEKAKILLAQGCRVYGPDQDADEEEYNHFIRVGCAIAGITPATLNRVSEKDVVALLLAWDREEAQPAEPRKPGRPAMSHQHVWIMATIEAYIGVGLRRKAAINRACDEWKLAKSTIDKIYHDNKLPKSLSKQVRTFFIGDTPEDVDRAIRRVHGNDP
jgi:hypothetical protein